MSKRPKQGDDRGSDSRSHAENRVTYWIPDADIEMSALAFYLSEFVDPTFTLKSGPHFQKKSEYGYYIQATQGLDPGDIAAIKSDSRDWVSEATWKKDTAKSRRKLGAKRIPRTGKEEPRHTSQAEYSGGTVTKISSRHDDRRPSQPPANTQYSTSGGYAPMKADLPPTKFNPSHSDPGFVENRMKVDEDPYDPYKTYEEPYKPMEVDPPRQPSSRQPTTTGQPGFQGMTATADAVHDYNYRSRDPPRQRSRERDTRDRDHYSQRPHR